MATLRDIKRRIAAVTSTKKITQAMKMVSAAKLKRAQDAIINARPYSNLLKSNLELLINSIGTSIEHPLLEKRPVIQNFLLVVIAADRGLCGSFNSNLIRFTLRYIDTEIKANCQNPNIKIIRIGKRIVSGLKSPEFEYPKDIVNISGQVDYQIIENLSNYIIDEYETKSVDKVIIFFNEFKNVLTQIPRTFNLLPFEPSASNLGQSTKYNINYIFEPEPNLIINSLIPMYIENQVLRIILESNASEQAARRLAMENATNNAIELIKHLELVFNKERQAAITKEMLEIVGGANALRSKQ